jgi:hypothetical protein
VLPAYLVVLLGLYLLGVVLNALLMRHMIRTDPWVGTAFITNPAGLALWLAIMVATWPVSMPTSIILSVVGARRSR